MGHSAYRRPRVDRHLHLEQLESRLPLATLVDGSTVRYQDRDGDTVLVSLSRPLLTAANADAVFRFDTGSVDGGEGRQHLQEIRLTALGTAARGVNVFARVSPSGAAGDGAVAIGQISAAGIDLGAVRIDGSLGSIRSGDANLLTPGLASLSMHDLGADASAGTTSVVRGRINSVTGIEIRGELRAEGGAAGQIGSIELIGGIIGGPRDEQGRVTASGGIGTVSIGSLQGGAGENSGRLSAASFRSILVRDPARGVLGGAGVGSGLIDSSGSIGTLTINGRLEGGEGESSGSIFVLRGGISTLTINGNIRGGAGELSGWIRTNGSIGRFTAKQIVGGSGGGSATIVAGAVTSAAVELVAGGRGEASGGFLAGRLDDIVVGDVRGGDGDGSGFVIGLTLGRATVGLIQGGNGARSGRVIADTVRSSVTAAGVRGGAGDDSGTIRAMVRLQSVQINGDIEGGSGRRSGSVSSAGSIGTVSVRNIRGFIGPMSGTVFVRNEPLPGDSASRAPAATPRSIDSVRVAGSVYGDNGESSGAIVADSKVKNVVIGTTINPAAGSLRGGAGVDSGTIRFGPPAYPEATVGYEAVWPKVQLIDVVGGSGLRSGGIRGGLLNVRVSLVIGGSGEESGAIAANYLWINAERHQREGLGIAAGGLADIEGGSGAWSGSVRAKFATVVIRDLSGGEGPNSGSLVFTNQSRVRARTIEGGGGNRSGRVQGNVLQVIAEEIRGGIGIQPGTVESGAIVARNLDVELRAGSGTRGELVAGAGGTAGQVTRNGAIIAKQLTATLGGIVGSETNPALVAAVDRITRLQVNSSVDRGLIVAGQSFDAFEIVPPGATAGAGILWPLAMNADARIDLVDIRGDLRRSSIAAGVRPVDAFYGNLDDAKLVGGRPSIDSPTVASRIELVLIRGGVFGTPDVTGDTFGIVAQQLGRVRVGYGPTIDPRNFWRETFPERSGPSLRLLYTGDDPARRDVWLRSLGGR